MEDPAAKVHGTGLRTWLLPCVSHDVVETQYGSGRNGGSTEMAFLQQSASEQAVGTESKCSVVVYGAIASAFAEVQKTLIIPDVLSKDTLREAALHAGFTVDVVDEVLEMITTIDGWSQGGASHHLQALVQERLRLNTSSFEGVPGVCEMVRGTGAGNPIADILFSIVFCKLVRLLRLELRRLGLKFSASCCGAATSFGWDVAEDVDVVDIPEVSYADDVAMTAPAEAMAVEWMIAPIVKTLRKAYTACGFRVKFGATKTAARVVWRGKDAVIARRAIEANGNKIIVDINGQSQEVHVVDAYKYLGARTTGQGMAHDIALRNRILAEQTKPLRKRLFDNEDVSVAAKKNTLSSILLSRKLLHCGCWPHLRVGEYRKFHSSTISMYKLVIPASTPQGLRC